VSDLTQFALCVDAEIKARALELTDPETSRLLRQLAHVVRGLGVRVRRHEARRKGVRECVRRELLASKPERCPLCDKVWGDDWNDRPTIDHIKPQSLGGGHERANLRVICAYCNSSRGNRMEATA
jgi:5-methylcytosine-specific restriction endonuclease McrA